MNETSAESCPYMVIYWQDILPFCWEFCAVKLMDGSQIDFFMKVFFLGGEWDADITSFKQMYFIDLSKAVLQSDGDSSIFCSRHLPFIL